MALRLFSLLAVLTTWPLASFAALADFPALAVCDEIYDVAPSRLAYAPSSPHATRNRGNLTALYTNTQTTYWDAANDADVPACMFFPASAQDVSAAVKALRKEPSVPFALKSGGHNWNRGFSSTNGGVLLSFRPNLQSTVLASDGQTAKVGPGSRWLEAMQTLDKSNKCVVGGRVGDVGVGGYLLQGGISYLSPQHGFACDNVVEYELVTANGTILTVNKDSHTDIFWALRGGGNAFGIVTTYTLKTYDIGDIWGGTVTYSAEHISELNAAFADFIEHGSDSRATLLFNYLLLVPGQTPSITLNLFYDGPSPPPSTFAKFRSIENLTDSTKTQRYAQLLDAGSTSKVGLRTTNAINSFPNLPSANMTSFLNWQWSQALHAPFLNTTKRYDLLLFSLALQPVPLNLQRASAAQGPGALSLDPSNGDKVWIEYDLGWNHTTCDQHCPSELKCFVDQSLSHQQQTYDGVRPTHYSSGNLSFVPYNPLFMNDAQFSQDVLRSYGDTAYNRLKNVHKGLDPTGFLTSRQKGFFFDT